MCGPVLTEVPDIPVELKAYKLAENEDGSYRVDCAFTKPCNALPVNALDADYEGTCQRSLATFVSMEMLASRSETSEHPLKMIVIDNSGYMVYGTIAHC